MGQSLGEAKLGSRAVVEAGCGMQVWSRRAYIVGALDQESLLCGLCASDLAGDLL